MRVSPDQLRLYLVSDRRFRPEPLEDQLACAIDAGVTVVQFREKDAATGDAVTLGLEVAKLCREKNVPLIVNDRLDIALAIDADGVHLGRDDMPIAIARRLLGPDKIIGATASTVAEAKAAEAAGADYLGVGAILPTKTKPDHSQVIGLDGLRAVACAVAIPCVGISGIDAGNAADVVASGAVGIAVVSAILGAADLKQAAADLRAAVDAGLELS